MFPLLDRGDEAGATRLVAARLAADPRDADANKVQAMIHGAHERFEEAASCLRVALHSNPDDPETLMMLGNVMVATKGYEEGASAFEAYLRTCPTDAGAVMGLGQCLISLGRTEEAVAAMERGIEASPDDANMYGYMASVLVAIGQVARAMAIVKRGYARLPHATGLLSFIVQNSNFLEGVDPVEHRDQHRRLCDAWAAHAPRAAVRLDHSLDPERTLRVGFLSGDFKVHACAFFMRSVIPLLDRRRTSVYCYSTAAAEDAMTSVFKSGTTWRPVAHLDDASLATTIRADRIDVLVDCSGHFDGNRLPALQPRVAPVQCTWLGYPNTTGLATMDWRIVDAITDPPEHDGHLSERAARLPACFVCYTPPSDAPEVSARDDAEPIVFGSFNRLDKVTESTLDAWCRVLRAVPGSRMAIKSRMMKSSVALLMLPWRRSTSRLWWPAPGGSPSEASTASITRGPPGWMAQPPTASRESPCPASAPSTHGPTACSSSSGTRAPSIISKPWSPTSHPISPAVAGNSRECVARIAGCVASADMPTTHAAQPSAKSVLAMSWSSRSL